MQSHEKNIKQVQIRTRSPWRIQVPGKMVGNGTWEAPTSVFTCRPNSLLVSIRASVPLWYICYVPTDLHYQHTPEADVPHFITVPPGFLRPSWWCDKANLKSNGDKVSPCFQSFWIGNISDKCLSTWTWSHI